MKKILVFILITIFIASSSMAAENKSYIKEFNMAKAMGFMQSGAKPDSILTKAEAAVLICRMLGYEYSNIKANPAYADVPENHWAYGAIHLLAHEGIITDTAYYYPSSEIKPEQFIKMLISSLKYDLLLTRNGYAKAANELQLIASGEENQPLTKAFTAYLLCNAMNVNPQIFETPFKSGYSVMQKNQITEICGKIESISLDSFTLKPYSIKIQAENAEYNKEISASDEGWELADTMTILTSSALTSAMSGKECIAYIYSPLYKPQLKFLAADDFYTAMEVKPEKSARAETEKIVFSGDLYDYISKFSNGYAAIKKDGKCGAIDEKGNIVINPEYEELGSFADNLFPVKKDGKMGYIDLKGKPVISCKWNYCSSFSGGAAVFLADNGKYGLINKNGKYIADAIYDSLAIYENGFSIASQNGKFGVLGNKGNTVIAFKYDDISYLGCKVFTAASKGKTIFIKADSGSYFENKWEKVSEFYEGYASVLKAGKWGLINDKGTVIIPPQYEEQIIFKNGLAVVRQGSFQGIIDIKNNFVIPAKWTELKISGEYIQYKSKYSGLYGLMDKSGKITCEDIFISIENVSGGKIFGVLYDGKSGFLDTNNKFKYSDIYKIKENSTGGFVFKNEINYGFMEW